MKNKEKYPEFIARFYDIIYEKIRDGVDNVFFLNKAANCHGPMLELGVGTGRLFLDALKKGADIYGIDISPAMIKVLHEKMSPSDRKRVWVQDAAEMEMDMKFDLIIAPFRMFSHVVEVEDQLNVLNRVEEHLNPGGEFIMDLFVPNLKLLDEGISDLKDFEGEYKKGNKIQRIISAKSNLIDQITNVKMKILWEEGEKEISRIWDFRMRYFFRFEIEHLIRISRLELDIIYGDYNENILNPQSKEFIIVCKKPH